MGTGWPPGEDLLSWATDNGRLPAVAATIGGLADAVVGCARRNDAALQTLASALRDRPCRGGGHPPGDHAGPLPRRRHRAGPAGPRSGAGSIGTTWTGWRSTCTPPTSACRRPRRGVQAALDKARADGGSAQLLVYESASSTSQGRAAISVGDITVADNVVTLAPGVSSSPTTMIEGIDDAAALRDRSEQLDSRTTPPWSPGTATTSRWERMGGSPDDSACRPSANVATVVNDAGGQGRRAAVGAGPGARSDSWRRSEARFIGMRLLHGLHVVSAAARPRRRLRRPGPARLTRGRRGGRLGCRLSGPDAGARLGRRARPGSRSPPAVTDELAGLLTGLGLNPLQPTPFGPDPADARLRCAGPGCAVQRTGHLGADGRSVRRTDRPPHQ